MTGNSLESKQPERPREGEWGENSMHKSPEGWQLRCVLEKCQELRGVRGGTQGRGGGDKGGNSLRAENYKLQKRVNSEDVSLETGVSVHRIPVVRSTGQGLIFSNLLSPQSSAVQQTRNWPHMLPTLKIQAFNHHSHTWPEVTVQNSTDREHLYHHEVYCTAQTQSRGLTFTAPSGAW